MNYKAKQALEKGLVKHLEQALAIENPLWEYVENVPHDKLGDWRRPGHFTPSWSDLTEKLRAADAAGEDTSKLRYTMFRDRVTARWSWAIPSPETLAFVLSALDGRPIVEIGAGSGYWAWMLTQLGVEVAAYDKAPVGHEDSWFTGERLERGGWEDYQPEEFYPVQVGGPEKAADHPDSVLLLVWPTMSSFAYEALAAFKGDTIIYVGEGSGGCTAAGDFFEAVGQGCCCWDTDDDGNVKHDHEVIDQIFEEVGDGPLTSWSGINDWITVYRRI